MERRGPGRKPRDDIIEREIRRRQIAGEPISYGAIRGTVGGSPATIKRVLQRLGLLTDPRADAEKEWRAQERLRDAGAKLAEAEALVQGAREASVAMAREITGTLGMVRDAHGILIREVEALRRTMVEVKRELAAHRPAQVGDPILEAKLRQAHSENGRMAQTIEQLKRRLYDAGVEDV